ncbi:MAG: hypothetical protein P1U36_06005 [Legionellaceae bacterium]|nr:hypothetical protein [Legionellaceae bacterium]
MPSESKSYAFTLINSLFNATKYLINHPLSLLTYALYSQAWLTESFNQQTLENVHNYLLKHRLSLTWEINESGFVRIQLPTSLLDFNKTRFSHEDTQDFRLRSNFWYSGPLNGSVSERLADAAAHDHPRGFMSYIVNKGYVHEVFDVVSYDDTATDCQVEIKQEETDECMLLSISNKKQNKFEAAGTAQLKKTEESGVEPGDIVMFDDKAVHRIKEFQADTLTLNAVRLEGDEETHIYIPPHSPSEAKKNRIVLVNDDALKITDQAIEIYRMAIEKSVALVPDQTRTLNYTAPHRHHTLSMFEQASEQVINQPVHEVHSQI